MRKKRKLSFNDLVNENKAQLIKDEAAMAEIEERLDNRHYQRLKEGY